jgi:catechol 2,3-dioxygenase-like lactoylglutathione lyase family enzyme
MAIIRLDHCLIVTNKLRATRDFFVDAIGLTEGSRPFTDNGYWLYHDGVSVLHLAGSNEGESAIVTDPRSKVGFDHLAFRATGYQVMCENFAKHQVPFSERSVPHLQEHQVFVQDPNGVKIELNFPLSEVHPTTAPKVTEQSKLSAH